MPEYKKSIWEPNPKYKTENDYISHDLLRIIDTIQSIEAAKKRVPPIPLQDLIKIAKKCKNLPSSDTITSEQFEKKLNHLLSYGAGIKMTIAIIAGVSHGQYPPIDKKNLSGLVKMQVITANEKEFFSRKKTGCIANVYVNKILPKWRKERNKGKLPQAIDEEWAKAR